MWRALAVTVLAAGCGSTATSTIAKPWFVGIGSAADDIITAESDGKGGAIVASGTLLTHLDANGVVIWQRPTTCGNASDLPSFQLVGATAQGDGTFVAAAIRRYNGCPLADACVESLTADGKSATPWTSHGGGAGLTQVARTTSEQFAVAGIASGDIPESCPETTDYNPQLQLPPYQSGSFVAGPPGTWAQAVPAAGLEMSTSRDGEICASGTVSGAVSVLGTPNTGGGFARWVARLGPNGEIRFVHVFAQSSAVDTRTFLVAATPDGRCTVAGTLTGPIDLGALGTVAPPSLPIIAFDATGPVAVSILSTGLTTIAALAGGDTSLYAAVESTDGSVANIGTLASTEAIIELVDLVPTRVMQGFDQRPVADDRLVLDLDARGDSLVVAGTFLQPVVVGIDPSQPDVTLAGPFNGFVGVVIP
jgi:hypothetical protein